MVGVAGIEIEGVLRAPMRSNRRLAREHLARVVVTLAKVAVKVAGTIDATAAATTDAVDVGPTSGETTAVRLR